MTFRLVPGTLTALFFLGFSSGLPLMLSGSTLQAWFASEGTSLMDIGLLTLAGQPYIYKFLWAPLMDRFAPPFLKNWLDKRRRWIAVLQISLAVVLACMAFKTPAKDFNGLIILAFVLAFLSATQDIAIDGYRTVLLKPNEQGMGNAWFVSAYRMAMISAGGLALIAAQHYGWKNTYLAMACLMFALVPVSFLSPGLADPPLKQASFKAILLEPFMNFLSRPYAKICLLFLVTYKIGDAFTVSLASAFYIKVLHFSLATVGTVTKFMGFASAISGSLLGGVLLYRMSLYRALLYFGLLQASCSFLFLALAFKKSLALFMLTVFADSFFSGMSTTALLALTTRLCHRAFSATQFTLFSALSSIGRVFTGPLAAVIITQAGWKIFFLISFVVSLPGLALLYPLRNRYDGMSKNTEELSRE